MNIDLEISTDEEVTTNLEEDTDKNDDQLQGTASYTRGNRDDNDQHQHLVLQCEYYEKPDSTEFVSDTGATQHLCNEQDAFSTLNELK